MGKKLQGRNRYRATCIVNQKYSRKERKKYDGKGERKLDEVGGIPSVLSPI